MSGKVLFLVVVSMVVLVHTSPIKEKDFDEIIFRLAEMKSELHLDARELDAGSFDVLGGGYLLKKKSLDPLGGGHLVRNLDTLGGGHLVRDLDSLGGGHLIRNLDSLGSGHLVRQVAGSNLDNLGGGHLIDGSNGKLIRY